MHSTRVLGALVAAAIALTALGGVGIIATRTLTSAFVVAAGAVLALVVVIVAGATLAGQSSGGSTETPYW